jgi:phosphatidylserine/phosphatidylglycerophosphate/cardiolipin synthase-like enzyme
MPPAKRTVRTPPNLARYWRLWLLTLVLFLAVACDGNLRAPATGTQPGSTQAAPPASPWIEVCFTNPKAPEARTLRGGCDEPLAQAIRAARVSVDAAIYDLDLWSIRNALLDAHKRGLSVRIVTETDNLERPEMQALIKAGIEVRDDRQDGLMHNKFFVIDRQEVWTGSMNFTVNGAYFNDNNLLRLRSSKLAQNYIVEFEEMFVDKRFGPGSPANTPFPSLMQDGVTVEVFFSPDDGAQKRIVELLKTARQSIRFMAFSFTADELAAAIIERARSGVKVQGVMESRQVETNIGGDFENFVNAGLDVRLDGNSRSMHHKVIIIDGKLVITGSYNFSYSAETRNDENVLILHGEDIASLYLQEFERILREAR